MGVPRFTAAEFEQIPTFRETFLVGFTEPADAAAFRRVGRLLFHFLNEYRVYFPDPGERMPKPEFRAVLADLRFLEGYLGIYLGPDHVFAAELARGVRKLANRLDKALRNARGF